MSIPALQLIEQTQQPLGILRSERYPETGGILPQGLDRTRVDGTFRGASGLTSVQGIDHTLQAVRLLLVEDDAMIGEAVRAGLKREGFAVDWVHEAAAAAQALASEPFELLLLDLGLPGADGLQLLKSLRARGKALPVLIITARDAVSDRVLGLDAGADDYLTKPFDLDELAARIRALLRRKSGRAASVLEHLGVVLDPASHRVTQQGVEVALSPREFALLQLLMERPGAILSRAQIEERLYGWGEEVESNAVEVHIHGLRRKLGAPFILTVRGVGYRVRPQA
jgi:two-component system response regulator QseB